MDIAALTTFLSQTQSAGSSWEAILPKAIEACDKAIKGKTNNLH
jgi:hypothetical protein